MTLSERIKWATANKYDYEQFEVVNDDIGLNVWVSIYEYFEFTFTEDGEPLEAIHHIVTNNKIESTNIPTSFR